jgi:hypothetical protein
MKTRKAVSMLVTVSIPKGKSPRWARRNVRNLINYGTGWDTYPGDDQGVKARKVEPEDTDLLDAAKEALEFLERHTSGIVIDAKDSLRMAIAKREGR